jgi:hypothetical protein
MQGKSACLFSPPAALFDSAGRAMLQSANR